MSTPQPATPQPATFRLVAVQTPQPPLDGDHPPLRLVLPGVLAPRPPHRPGRRPLPTGHVRDDFGPMWSARSELPDARAAGRQLLVLALEALAGRRPLTQLQPVTSPRTYAALTGRRHPAWCAAGTAPLVLGRVHVCEPVDGVAEVSAVAHRSGRAHAVAARLEGIDGRWRCTALQIG
ncbi:MAG: hypothetical protein QOJ68_3555 [Blastococcus sp.]|jgi:hypothetical protein|nr:hypothetical protein [Blastococcus sp.]